MIQKAFWVGDKQFVVETATAKEKAELKAENPKLYARYFGKTKVIVPVVEKIETIETDVAKPTPKKEA